MLRLEINSDVLPFLRAIERKHAGQIALRLLQLLVSPDAPDVRQLKGELREFKRATVGEYRIIFVVEQALLRVVLIDRRNDDEVYKALSRKRQAQS